MDMNVSFGSNDTRRNNNRYNHNRFSNLNTQDDEEMIALFNEYKVNEWISEQKEEHQSILKETIGLEFDLSYYRSRHNNHGWQFGHGFEAEHKRVM